MRILAEADYDLTGCLLNCSNNGICKNTTGILKCECFENFNGSSCELSLDPCYEFNPCVNGGVCDSYSVNSTWTFNCSCKNYYYGKYCENKINICENETCSFNVYCKIINSKPICKCVWQFEGSRCEIEMSNLTAIKKVIKVSYITAIVILILFYLLFILNDCMNYFCRIKSVTKINKKHNNKQKKNKNSKKLKKCKIEPKI
jgi:hypothetical protein